MYFTNVEDAASPWSTTLTKHVLPMFCNQGIMRLVEILRPFVIEDATDEIAQGMAGGCSAVVGAGSLLAFSLVVGAL